MLAVDDPRRYACQIKLAEVGVAGQARLRAATCAVDVNASSTAQAWALSYLAAAGVGTLALAGDVAGAVTAQEAIGHPVLHAIDAGKPRGDAYARRLVAQNPSVRVALDVPPRCHALAPLADTGNALADGAAAAATTLLGLAAPDLELT